MSAGPQLVFDVSPFVWASVRWYSLCFIGELLLSYRLLARQIRRGGGDDEDASDLAVYLWVGLLLGARLAEGVFYNLDKVATDPAWLLRFYAGGMSGHGAVLGAVLAARLYALRRALPLLDVLDRITLASSVIAVVHRLATLMNSELVGRQTDGSWGVRFPYFDRGAEMPLRHPLPAYEAIWGTVLAVLLWLADERWKREQRPRGALTGLALVCYFSGRFLLDFFQEPLAETASWLHTSQWLSLPFIGVGVVVLRRSLRRHEPAGFCMLEETSEGAPESDDAPSSAT